MLSRRKPDRNSRAVSVEALGPELTETDQVFPTTNLLNFGRWESPAVSRFPSCADAARGDIPLSPVTSYWTEQPGKTQSAIPESWVLKEADKVGRGCWMVWRYGDSIAEGLTSPRVCAR